MRWKVVASVLGLAVALLWGGLQLSAAAGVEGGMLETLRQVSVSARRAVEPALGGLWPAPGASPARNVQALAPGSISVSIGPVVTALAGFITQPSKGAHTFSLGIQPRVELRDGQGNLQTGDSLTVVLLRIRPGTGSPGAALTCNEGLSQTVSAGVALYSGCKIDLKGDGYVLEATGASTSVAVTPAFSVVWAGDANGDCQVDIVDFSVLVRSFGKSLGDAGYDARADLSGDNLVDIVDFSVFVTLFGTRCPALALAPASGAEGTVVTLTGSAYVANREVSFTFDEAALTTTPATVLAGGSGGFTASFTVPAGTAAGTHVVKASQAAGRVIAAAILTVP